MAEATAWDGVPWFVGGGAQHSPEVARLLGHFATNGEEGVLSSADLRVRARSVPDSSVEVLPGACSILNRATAQAYQAYLARLPRVDSVAISATDASGPRSDLIVARIEDPFLTGEPWDAPEDPTNGPYVFTRVIPNVPPGTVTVPPGLGYSAIPLARIDLPASTGTVTDAMIVDLRRIPNPRRVRNQYLGFPSSSETLNVADFRTFPSAAAWTVEIPEWATRAIIRIDTIGPSVDRDVQGQERIRLGSLFGRICPFDLVDGSRANLVAADEFKIPANMRGTSVPLNVQANRKAGTGTLQSGTWITVVADVEFLEA